MNDEPPWDDCKVAFSFDGDPEVVWTVCGCHKPPALPAGWEMIATDAAGARVVVIFRVDGIPTAKAGNRVRQILDALEKRQPAGIHRKRGGVE